jgi:microtubule-associated serine/threonine kinase
VLEIAKLCLEKSRSSQLTCSYFDEMIQSLEKLLLEAREKCSTDGIGLEHLQKIIKRFLLNVSRVARLLECIEFDPLEFCFLLDFAEQQARQEAIKIDIPKYIISKLGIDKFDPFEDFKTAEEEPVAVPVPPPVSDEARGGSYSRASSITGANSSSGFSSTDVADFGSEAGSTASSSINNANVKNPNEITPCEEDFHEIKLISNGAYG